MLFINRKIKAVVFDMDGVLVDTEIVYWKRNREFFKHHKIDVPDEILNQTVGSDSRKSWKLLRSYFHESWDYDTYLKNHREFTKEKTLYYREYLNPTVKETLEQLKLKGYQVALASSTPLSKIEKILGECELIGYFSNILSGEMFRESKPNPEIYLKSAKDLSLEPCECMAVEDSDYGIEAAIRAGMLVTAKIEDRFGLSQSKANFKVRKVIDIIPILEDINKSKTYLYSK